MYVTTSKELLTAELGELQMRVEEAMRIGSHRGRDCDPQTSAQEQVSFALSCCNCDLIKDASTVLGLGADPLAQLDVSGLNSGPIATLDLWPEGSVIEPMMPDLGETGMPTLAALRIAKQYFRMAQIGHELSNKFRDRSYLVQMDNYASIFQDARRQQRKLEADIQSLTERYCLSCLPDSQSGKFGKALLRAARYFLKRSREDMTAARLSLFKPITSGIVYGAAQQTNLGSLALSWARTRLADGTVLTQQ